MVTTLLEKLGYRVFTAANGMEALSLKQKRDIGHIDLLFTDVVMPHMSGKELSRAYPGVVSAYENSVHVGFYRERLCAPRRAEQGSDPAAKAVHAIGFGAQITRGPGSINPLRHSCQGHSAAQTEGGGRIACIDWPGMMEEGISWFLRMDGGNRRWRGWRRRFLVQS